MRDMKKPAILAASLAAVLAVTLPATTALADDVVSAISVSGEASVSAAPDLAQIDAGVANDAKTAKEASDANNAAMGKVLLALKGAGIAEKDYQTSRLSLQAQYASNNSRNGPNVITGYRASNRVTIKVRDVSKIASVIDTLVGAGANDIGGINFMPQLPKDLPAGLRGGLPNLPGLTGLSGKPTLPGLSGFPGLGKKK